MTSSSIPGQILLVATLIAAMGVAAMSPLPASIPAKAPTAAVSLAGK